VGVRRWRKIAGVIFLWDVILKEALVVNYKDRVPNNNNNNNNNK
jgi:hypothetical protein